VPRRQSDLTAHDLFGPQLTVPEITAVYNWRHPDEVPLTERQVKITLTVAMKKIRRELANAGVRNADDFLYNQYRLSGDDTDE
jgi:hypothetical protein